MSVAQYVESWGAIVAIRTSPVLYPFVNSLHIIGLCMLIGAIVPQDLRIVGVWRREGWRGSLAAASRTARFGLSLCILTGSVLFAVRASHYLQNPAMLVKFGLIIFGLLNVMAFHLLLRNSSGDQPTPILRALAVVSAVTWIGAIFAGRWIAFIV